MNWKEWLVVLAMVVLFAVLTGIVRAWATVEVFDQKTRYVIIESTEQ